MYRVEINTHEIELRVKLVIYKDYNEIQGQQYIKYKCCFSLSESYLLTYSMVQSPS